MKQRPSYYDEENKWYSYDRNGMLLYPEEDDEEPNYDAGVNELRNIQTEYLNKLSRIKSLSQLGPQYSSDVKRYVDRVVDLENEYPYLVLVKAHYYPPDDAN